MKESDILHETENLYLCKVKKGLEIRLNGTTHSVVVGNPTLGVERAKLTMTRLENGIDEVRKMYQFWK